MTELQIAHEKYTAEHTRYVLMDGAAQALIEKLATTTRELEAAKAQIAELMTRLATACEALEWCEQAGFTILHEQVRNIARTAIAAIRAPETKEALECTNPREQLRAALMPIRREHDKHTPGREDPTCPFCNGDIT